jgi:hypothetical protein
MLDNNNRWLIYMLISSSLIQAAVAAVSAVSLAQVVRALFILCALAGFVMFFRPLLIGIGRALVLAVRPRQTEVQLAARLTMYKSFLQQRGIHLPSTPAETPVASRG